MCSTCQCDADPIRAKDDGLTNSPENRLKCRKCGSDPFIVMDKVHLDCKSCFLESANRKIRSTIGKTRLLKNNDPILVAYSGGASSLALLKLIEASMQYEARREQKFRPSILHIDTESIMGPSFEAVRERRLTGLKRFLDQTHRLFPDWPIYWTTLETNAAPTGPCLYESYCPDKSVIDCRHHMLNDMTNYSLQVTKIKDLDPTELLTFISDSIDQLIIRVTDVIMNSPTVASHNRPKFVFTGHSSNQLANNLMVDVILGRGASIHHAVSVCDKRNLSTLESSLDGRASSSIPIMRPLREFSKKELVFYLRASDLEGNVVTRISPSTFCDRRSSIQRLTEAFLSKLYTDYPSTYSTLLRTGSKMRDQSN